MTLNVRVMGKLDGLAMRAASGDKHADVVALDYINQLPTPPRQMYLHSAYVKYYFKAKQHAKEEGVERAEVVDVPYSVKWWRGC